MVRFGRGCTLWWRSVMQKLMDLTWRFVTSRKKPFILFELYRAAAAAAAAGSCSSRVEFRICTVNSFHCLWCLFSVKKKCLFQTDHGSLSPSPLVGTPQLYHFFSFSFVRGILFLIFCQKGYLNLDSSTYCRDHARISFFFLHRKSLEKRVSVWIYPWDWVKELLPALY